MSSSVRRRKGEAGHGRGNRSVYTLPWVKGKKVVPFVNWGWDGGEGYEVLHFPVGQEKK